MATLEPDVNLIFCYHQLVSSAFCVNLYTPSRSHARCCPTILPLSSTLVCIRLKSQPPLKASAANVHSTSTCSHTSCQLRSYSLYNCEVVALSNDVPAAFGYYNSTAICSQLPRSAEVYTHSSAPVGPSIRSRLPHYQATHS